MEIKITDLIAPNFYELHNIIKNEEYFNIWLTGGRNSLKSSFVSIEIILGMARDEKANAVVLRKVGKYLKDSVYNTFIWAIDKLGLTPYYIFLKSPLKIVNRFTGQTISFFGLDEPLNLKSIKSEKGYFRFIWYEEANQFDGMPEIRSVNLSLGREHDKPYFFYTYNPPPETDHWINEEIAIKKDNRIIHHSTYLEVPKEWIKQNILLEAEELKKYHPLQYENEFLGKVTGRGLNVFNNIESRIITDTEINNLRIFGEGIDWGYSVDPFAWMAVGYNRKYKDLYIFDEVYGVGFSNPVAIQLVKSKHRKQCVIKADDEEPKSIDEFCDAGLETERARKPAGSRHYYLKWLQGCRKIIIDPERCPNADREFRKYQYVMDKAGRVKSEYPDKDNHTIDAVCYSIREIETYI